MKPTSSSKYRIIVVEDDQLILTLTKIMLNQIQSDAHTFDKAKDALALLEKDQNFDLLILDLTLSGKDAMSGLDLIEAIKSNNKTSHIPILLQTGVTAQSTLSTAIRLGAEDYIIKPYLKEQLIEKILACVKKSPKSINESTS